MFVVAVKVIGKKKYFVEANKSMVRYSDTIGEWTPMYDEKMANKVAKMLLKKFKTINEVIVEKVA